MSRSWFAFALLAGAVTAHAGDAFDGLNCNEDIAKALVRKSLANGPVEALEKKHAAIGLRHEGSEELPKSLDYEAWTICGSTYHFIMRKDVIADVVRADHSKTAPSFLGTCDERGAPAKYEVLAILKTPSASKDEARLPATAAWRIDDAHARFVEISPVNLMCPRDGIATVDGGP